MKRLKTTLFPLLAAIPLSLQAIEIQTIHSSVQTYMEFKSFDGSRQKINGNVYGVGADIHAGTNEYRLAYEKGMTDTLQPPLQTDLRTDKLFLRYAYHFDNAWCMNINYLDILHDNIAITDGGRAFGLGATWHYSARTQSNFTQFLTRYDDFDVYQSDLKIEHKMRIDSLRLKVGLHGIYIHINEEHPNTFTKNADQDYFTAALQLHAHYESWHFGAVAYAGKRVFAIMNDGFKIQHHAMEFDRTYAVGIGKTFGDFVLRVQYIYQRATELPIDNENVTVKNTRVILNYKF